MNPGLPDHWWTLHLLGQWPGIHITLYLTYDTKIYLNNHLNQENRSIIVAISVGFGFFVRCHINLRGLFNATGILVDALLFYYLTPACRGGDKRVHTFFLGIRPKLKVIARLKFELAYYDYSTLATTPPELPELPQQYKCLKSQCINAIQNHFYLFY